MSILLVLFPFVLNPAMLNRGGAKDDWGTAIEIAFSQKLTIAVNASSRAAHSILKEHMSVGCNVPPSIVVSVVLLLYLAIILHPVDELPWYLQPPSDWMKTLGHCVVLLCL